MPKSTNVPVNSKLPNITTPHYESGGEKDGDEHSKSPKSPSQYQQPEISPYQ